MAQVIGVKFREVGKVYYFDPLDNKFEKGDYVIVETVRGMECGEVALENSEVSDEEIFAAAEKTGFSEYLALCGNDLSTEVAAGGQSMSGGQGQRLVLTREVLRGGDIILMDEPTSALDVRVSAKIQDTIDELFAGKTRILITHDLDYARRYDRIIVMENGRIVGDGSHESLLHDCETYRAMNAHAGEEAAI